MDELLEHFYYDSDEGVVRRKADVYGCKGKILIMRKGDVVGGTYGKRSKYLRVTCLGKKFLLHRVVWHLHGNTVPQGFVIDHIDGDKTNNRVENLRCVPSQINSRNLNSDKGRESKSGVLFIEDKNGRCYYLAHWTEGGKLRTKTFSIRKFGIIEAMILATKFRDAKMTELNEKGYGYIIRGESQ